MGIERSALDLPQELQTRRRVLLGELKERSAWFVKVRWWVPPAILAGVAGARAAEVELAAGSLIAVAAFILAYNLGFHLWHRRFPHEPAWQNEVLLRRFTRFQVGFDYAAMFAFLHLSGGLGSPFILFFFFHIIFASILLKHRTAFLFASVAAVGVGGLALLDAAGWLPHRPLIYRGQPIYLRAQPLPLLLDWVLFSATAFLAVLATTNIMEMVRRRIYHLADLSESVLNLNLRLESLYAIGRSLVSLRRLEPVLDVVCSELARVMNVQGVTVKLLEEDGRHLVFAAVFGLPAPYAVGTRLAVTESPVNQRVIAGEPYARGDVGAREPFALGEDLQAAGVRSVIFVPLAIEERVLGILGAYCGQPDRFGKEDVSFLTLAAELAAVAVENARAYEAVERASSERERFMHRVAHNLKAPLAGVLGVLEVMQLGNLGAVNPEQVEYLRRAIRRAQALTTMIDELLLLAEEQHRALAPHPVPCAELAQRIERTFQEEASRRELHLEVALEPALADLLGDDALLERMLESLVDNALKYTPAGGEVRVAFSVAPEGVTITVSDTGIGIPAEALPKVFEEFYRAANAKAHDGPGTGLGLAIAKEIAERHGGRLEVASEEGRGTRFTVQIPTVHPNPEWRPRP